jgi:hypothetical protein
MEEKMAPGSGGFYPYYGLSFLIFLILILLLLGSGKKRFW